MMGIEGKFIRATRPNNSSQSQDEDYVHVEFKLDESLAQLENQFRSSPDFTLQKLWYYIQPTMQTLSSLDVLVGVIRAAGKKETDDEDMDDIEALLNPRVGIPLERKGGSILAIIAAGMFNMSGDPVAKKLYGFLLNKASVPYIAMLESWIHKGTIRDTYEEFMIVESNKVDKEKIEADFNDEYWEQRYTIREKYVPSFLVPLKTKILLAGKYLNVIRECGIHLSDNEQNTATNQSSGSANYTERNDVLATLGGGKLVDTIDAAYQYANRKLLDLLLKDKQLLGRLRSIKRYFFLDQSDFITHFLDLASVELKRPWNEVSLTKLQSLMDLVLRNPSSVTVNDTFKEDLKVDMSRLGFVDQLLRIISIEGQVQGQGQGDRLEVRSSNKSKDPRARIHSRANSGDIHQRPMSYEFLQDELMASTILGGAMEGIMGNPIEFPTQTKGTLAGIDSLVLDYSVKFPLSLVISRKALTRYQLLFRHLLYLKHGEQVLCNTWIEHAKSAVWKNASPELKYWRGRVYGLRSRMLTFVQQFAYYICYEVLEPNWNDMASQLTKASTVDQVLQIHSDFLDSCLSQCMLTNSKLLRIYSKLMSTSVKFTNYTDRFTRALVAMETQLDPEAAVMAPTNQIQHIEQAIKRLNELEDGFTYHLKLLIEALNFYSATETGQFLCLVVRLDYNQFYANQTSEAHQQQ
ncbi:hypothetical protein BGZ46_000382 [Entomortierella lignicola]|nr:hypothetical protein BGZ46_000382 [Entomortierella lignicola]